MVNQGLSDIWGKTAVWNGKTMKSKLKNLSWAMEAIKIVEKLQQNKLSLEKLKKVLHS